ESPVGASRIIRGLADALEAALTPPQIDRDKLAGVIRTAYETGMPGKRDIDAADAVIAHLSAVPQHDLNTEHADRVDALSAVPVEGDRETAHVRAWIDK